MIENQDVHIATTAEIVMATEDGWRHPDLEAVAAELAARIKGVKSIVLSYAPDEDARDVDGIEYDVDLTVDAKEFVGDAFWSDYNADLDTADLAVRDASDVVLDHLMDDNAFHHQVTQYLQDVLGPDYVVIDAGDYPSVAVSE